MVPLSMQLQESFQRKEGGSCKRVCIGISLVFSALLLSLGAEGKGMLCLGEGKGQVQGRGAEQPWHCTAGAQEVPLHHCAADHLWYSITDGPC